MDDRTRPDGERMKRLKLLSAFALAVGACQAEPGVWYKGGASESDYQRDTYECERDRQMAAASFGTGPVGAANAEAFAARCMNARGYDRVPASQPRPVGPFMGSHL